MKKQIPKFKNEAEEQAFWSKVDSTEYVDWSKGERVVMPKLKRDAKNTLLKPPEK